MDDAPSQAVIDFIFAKYCTGSCEQQVNDDDDADDDNDGNDGIDESVIRTYLEFVSSIPAVFDTEAFAMLKYYFIVTRATRPSKLTRIPYDMTFRKHDLMPAALLNLLFFLDHYVVRRRHILQTF